MLAAAAVIALLVLAALLGPLLSPYALDHVDWTLSPLASPPSLANGHWFGTDGNGRDLFVRVLVRHAGLAAGRRCSRPLSAS